MEIAAKRRPTRARWLASALAIAVCGCSSGGAGSGIDSDATSSKEHRYVLDFASPQGGGAPAGSMMNVAFNLDLDTPLRFYPYGERGPGFLSTFDFTGCQNVVALEMFAKNLEPGDPAWVGHVDLEIVPVDDSERDPSWTGGVCFGVRRLEHAWEWTSEEGALKYDAVTDRIRGRIPLETGPIDAVKLAFDMKQRHPMTRLVYTARPETADP